MRRGENLKPYHFKPGQPSANPHGRPVGARAKLTELATKMLAQDFEQHGEEVIQRVRERKPEVYLASVVSLLPKQQEKIDSPFFDLSDEELEQLEQLLAAMRAKTVRALDHVNGGSKGKRQERRGEDRASEPSDGATGAPDLISGLGSDLQPQDIGDTDEGADPV